MPSQEGASQSTSPCSIWSGSYHQPSDGCFSSLWGRIHAFAGSQWQTPTPSSVQLLVPNWRRDLLCHNRTEEWWLLYGWWSSVSFICSDFRTSLWWPNIIHLFLSWMVTCSMQWKIIKSSALRKRSLYSSVTCGQVVICPWCSVLRPCKPPYTRGWYVKCRYSRIS